MVTNGAEARAAMTNWGGEERVLHKLLHKEVHSEPALVSLRLLSSLAINSGSLYSKKTFFKDLRESSTHVLLES